MTVPKEATTPDMLRLAVAAVLEADKEFRANMPPEWEGDPLSDEIDGLRRVYSALSTLPIAGEGKVKALEWNPFTAYTPFGYHYSVWERDNGVWECNLLDGQFKTLEATRAAAQSDFETRILSALASSPGKDGGTAGGPSFADGIRAAAALFETSPDEPVDDITKLTREAQRQGILSLLKSGKDGGQEVEAVAWRRERDGWLNDQGLGVPLYTHPPHQITVDGEPVEPVARAIWNVRREEEDRCDMELEDMGEDHSVWAEARAVLSALSTFQPASTALVERLGLAWAAVGHHEGIEISVHADAADTWNALCAILDPLARTALSASHSTSRENADV